MNIQEIREKYPEYNDMDDTQLADSYHQKYYSDLPKEDFYSKIGFNPQQQNASDDTNDESYLRDIAIGLSKLGHKTLNTPYDLAKNLEEQGTKFGNEINKTLPMDKYTDTNRLPNNKSQLQQLVESFNKENKVPDSLKNEGWNGSFAERIPHQQEHDFAQLLGQEGEPSLTHFIAQKGFEYAPELALAGKALYELPITKYPGTRALNKLKKEVNARSIKKIETPKHIFQDIEHNKFLSNTQPNRNLLEKAKTGKYNDLFDLQSDLGKLERSYTRDYFNAANRQFGKDIGTTRQELLKSMKEQLSKLGHEDLAELLSHGQNKYRQYMKLRPYMHGAAGLGLSAIPGYNILKKLMP